MDNSFDFSEFSRQSAKGILVIYMNLIYKTIKLTWIFLFFLIKDFSKIMAVVGDYLYLGLGFLLLFLLIRSYMLYQNFQFKIEKEHFILQQGILKKTFTSIPFHRIQNINFKQNLIQQIINVYEVSVETAGSEKTEIAIKALGLTKAEAIKAIISKNAREKTETRIRDEAKPLVKISIKELFKVSLTENHLQNLFLFFAIVIGFFQQISQVFDGLGQTESLDGFIKENTNNLSASFFLITLLLVILIITALLSSFVRIFLVHFNLTTYLKEDSFEINQGLLTKKSIVLKQQKIQNITISTNPLKRLIGISFITFKQAVSGKLNKKNKEKLIKIVGCKKEQVEIIKQNLFDTSAVENSEIHFSDNYYKRRIFIFSLLFIVIAYTILFLIVSRFEIFYSLLLIIPIVVFLILKKVKKRFYKFTDSVLMVGRGLLETHHTYLELYKVQNIKLNQSIFQKRKNVVDLVFQTASGKITIPCIQFKDAIDIYNHTLYEVETSAKPWM